MITGREDYPARISGSGGTAKTRASGQVSVPLQDGIGHRGMLPLVRDARSLCASLAGAAPAGPLTRREEEVARLVARGLTSRQIAAALPYRWGGWGWRGGGNRVRSGL